MSGSPQDKSGPAAQASSITVLRSRSGERRSGVHRGLVHTIAVPVEPVIQATAAASVMSDGNELNQSDIEVLAAAVMRSRTVRKIWSGERIFPDRSRGHCALAAALTRSGCTDPDMRRRLIVAYDQRGDSSRRLALVAVSIQSLGKRHT